MATTLLTTFKVLGVILHITPMLLFLALIQFAQTHFASVGWHKLASIGWNG